MLYSAVLNLLATLEGSWHHVFLDNLYGNTKLAEELLQRKILYTSTMRSNRLPKTLILNKTDPKGHFISEKVGNVLILKWRDRNDVKFATTGHLSVEKVNHSQKTQR